MLAAVLALGACAMPHVDMPPMPGGAKAKAAEAVRHGAVIDAAVKDPRRPEADLKRDPARLPADMLSLAEVHRGDRIVDFVAGGGYFTRLFAAAAGSKGKVWAFQPAEVLKVAPGYGKEIEDLAAQYDNVAVSTQPTMALEWPKKLDLVWTAQNYHDLHDPFMGPADMAVINRRVFDALKPGGLYVIVDHAAEAGSDLRDTNTLHRIDKAAVRREVEAAGFVLEREYTLLANPADPHTANVFDKSIRGHTDQFILKFRKPRKHHKFMRLPHV